MDEGTRDEMNNEVSSNESTNVQTNRTQYKNVTNSDIANGNRNVVQTLGEADVGHQINIPIVGYEVMEERARFTIYKLKVEDSRRGQSWLVFRRYTDFVRLCARLQAERAPPPPPPLPGKRWLRDNFEPVFLEERARGLQVFVNALVRRFPDHPRVREFFCLDEPPQASAYQPEVQAVYGALEDSVNSLRTQLKQKDATIAHLQHRVAILEGRVAKCTCGNDS